MINMAIAVPERKRVRMLYFRVNWLSEDTKWWFHPLFGALGSAFDKFVSDADIERTRHDIRRDADGTHFQITAVLNRYSE